MAYGTQGGMNPMDIITMIRSGQNPQQIMINILEEGVAANNPIAANLLDMAKNNRTADIERVARNLCAERGLDFDKEFNNFKSNLFRGIGPKK
jgi:hypothetical protein